MRRKLVTENSHIIDEFFTMKAQSLLKAMFGQKELIVEWWWFPVEYQKRGTAHVHECLRLANALDTTTLAQDVLTGRLLYRHIENTNELHLLLDNKRFRPDKLKQDVWLPDPNIKEKSDNMLETLRETITKGIKAQKTITAFNDWIFAVQLPNPLSDVMLE